jgi:hypothetical protein
VPPFGPAGKAGFLGLARSPIRLERFPAKRIAARLRISISSLAIYRNSEIAMFR